MKDENKLIDAIIDLHGEIKLMRKESYERLEKIEGQLIRNNKAISELRLSVMKLAEHSRTFQEYDRRIRKIESILARKKLL